MLKGPKGAIPTHRGWVHPQSGELLKSQRITQEQLDNYNGVQMIVEPAPVMEMPEVEDDLELILDGPIEIEETPKPKKKKKKRSLFG